MEPSILTSVKKILNVGPDDTAFDQDIMTFINSSFSTLHQLGVGPAAGFMIEDETATWAEFIDTTDPQFNLVKTYVCLRTRISFDPPNSGYLVESLEKQIREHETRISINREDEEWVDPDPEEVIVDG